MVPVVGDAQALLPPINTSTTHLLNLQFQQPLHGSDRTWAASNQHHSGVDVVGSVSVYD